MATKTDISYGIIPLQKVADGWQVLLINQFSRIGNNTYWVFPKGHPNEGETPLDTARRELYEETGLVASSVAAAPTFTLEYTFIFEGDLIQKKVIFFLSQIDLAQQEIRLDPKEVKDAKWCSLTEAHELVDYRDTKAMVKRVEEYLESRRG